MSKTALGIDIGGSGIKGAMVDTESGDFVTKRYRIPTPSPATPQAIVECIRKIVQHFEYSGPVGCGYPGVVRENVLFTAVNLHPSLVGVSLGKMISDQAGCPVTILNDADAAGLAEMRLGAGVSCKGVVFLITIGTGLGTALFANGELVPNTELGHIEMNGKDAEIQASEAARKRNDWDWKVWAQQFNQYLSVIEALFWPEIFILGGGGAKKPDKFAHLLSSRTPIEWARFGNQAGIIGAAQAALDADYKQSR